MENERTSPAGKQPQQPKRPAAVLIILNLLLMLVVACVLGWLVMTWLGYWTNHGKTEVVPEVKGMQYEQAVATIAGAGMTAELSDSVYDSKARPGAVIEQNPKAGNEVKPGRTIFLTVNAFYPRMVAVPKLTDISLRQARSTLEGLGIKNIVEEKVVSEYKDLVLGADCNGRPMSPGMRLPVTATVILKVGDGGYEELDSLSADDIDLLDID